MNLMNAGVKSILAGLLMCVAVNPAYAVTLTLDAVTGTSKRGSEIGFAVESRAIFDYDPETEQLTSSGTWIAQNRTGPNLLIRYNHKVENFSASLADGITAKSYECVEGTFGAAIFQNYCGNYSFGKNQTDDGGLIDDRRLGPRLSLYLYEPAQIDWNGTTLIVVLVPLSTKPTAGLPELGLTLEFSVAAEDAAAEKTGR